MSTETKWFNFQFGWASIGILITALTLLWTFAQNQAETRQALLQTQQTLVEIKSTQQDLRTEGVDKAKVIADLGERTKGLEIAFKYISNDITRIINKMEGPQAPIVPKN